LITSISMRNWKAYDERKFDFSNGINFVVAPNGSGKTSLLEAICVGLVGKVRTVENERSLIREGQNQAEIILDFEPNEREFYRIERKIPREGNRLAYVYNSKGETIVSSWNRVNTFVEELLDLGSFFIERIVYASEGDVQDFINLLTKEKKLKMYIENILGIDRMENFLKILINLERGSESEIKELRKKSGKLEHLLPEENIEELTKSKKFLEEEIRELQERIHDVTGKINANKVLVSEKKRKLNEIISLKSEVQKILNTKIKEDEIIEKSQEAIKECKSEIDEINQNVKDLRMQRDRIRGEIDSQQKILDLVSSTDKEKEEIKCPVCKKPLSKSEVDSISMETRESIKIRNEQIHSLHKSIRNKNQELEYLSSKLENLREITIKTETLFTMDKYKAIQEFKAGIESLSSRIGEMSNIETEASREKEEKEQKKKEIERKIDRIKVTSEFVKPENLEADLVAKTKELYLAEMLRKASRKLIDSQRKINLEEIFREVAENVNRFLGSTNAAFSFDKVTVDGYDRDYSQLSGGEKIAILAIIRATLCKYFLNTGFLLFDEPLEHLDLSNRRFLVDFLVDCCREESIQQFIITTFEESMIRKYLGEDQVKVIMI